MAQRASGFSRKTEVAKAASVSVLAPVADLVPVALRALPLEIAPLLAPYKGRGKLTLRVERVPQLARLSAGRNNGDGTWSLASDELEGLAYLLPENLDKAHTLAIRIMAFDGAAASTLKMLDFPVSPGAAGQDAAAEPDAPEPERG